MKILIPQEIAQAGKQYLFDKGYEIKMGTSIDPHSLAEEIADCDGLLVRTAVITRNILEAGKKLKVVARHGVGVDHVDLAAASELGIQVTNAPLSNFESVAEHTVALILATAHHMTELDQKVRQGHWEVRNQVRLTSVSGKSVGIVGLGRIGRCVARKAALGLDMKVLAYDPYVSADQVPEYVEMVQRLDELCGRADFLTLHCPAVPETKGLIGKACFARMKPTAFLINCARGEVVNEAALLEALKTGRIQGAGLDVLCQEPPNDNNPLFKLDNVIFSPHCGAHSEESLNNMAVQAAMGIDEVLSGKPVSWPVNQLR